MDPGRTGDASPPPGRSDLHADMLVEAWLRVAWRDEHLSVVRAEAGARWPWRTRCGGRWSRASAGCD